MPITKPIAYSFSFLTVMIDEMFVNNGSVGVFNATELIYAVYKANKGGLDSLNDAYVNDEAWAQCSHIVLFTLQHIADFTCKICNQFRKYGALF